MRVTVACGTLAASLFAEVPGLDRVIVVKKKPFGRHWFDIWREIRLTRWDLIVDLRRSLVSYFVSTDRRLRLQRDDRTEHRVAFLSSLMGVHPPAPPKLWLAERHRHAAAEILEGATNPLAICPIAARPEKTWPRERFEELAIALIADGGSLENATLILVGAEADRPVLTQMRAALPNLKIIDLIGCDDLLTVAAFLSRCCVVIANDSGMAHLAAAAGAPTVALFGATRPDLYCPWGAHVQVVQAPTVGGTPALERLQVPEVVSAVTEVLA